MSLILEEMFSCKLSQNENRAQHDRFMYFVMSVAPTFFESATSCCNSLSISNYQLSCNNGNEKLFLCYTLVMREFFRHLEETCPTPGPTLVSM